MNYSDDAGDLEARALNTTLYSDDRPWAAGCRAAPFVPRLAFACACTVEAPGCTSED